MNEHLNRLRTSSFSTEKVTNALVLGFAFLFPIFFSPLSTDLFDYNKRLLLLVISLVLTALWGVQVVVKKEARITRTPWTIPMAGFALSALATILVVSSNKVAALLGTGGFYISVGLFFLAATSLLQKGFSKKLINVLSASGLAVALLTLIDKFGVNLNQLVNNAFGLSQPTTGGFAITGSPLFTVFFLGVCILMLVTRLLQKHTPATTKLSHGIFAAIMTVSMVLALIGILPGKPGQPQFLSTLDSWSIATDVMKNPITAVLGAGTDSYANAFSMFRPVRLNQTPTWFIRFNNARDAALELLTTQGVVGFVVFALLIIAVLRTLGAARGDELPIAIGVLACVGILLFFPPSALVISLLLVLLVAWAVSLKEHGIRTRESGFSLYAYTSGGTRSQFAFAQILGVIVTLVSGFGLVEVARAYRAEVIFNRGIQAAAKNQARDTYQYTMDAVVANPYMENYHRAFAMTNLTLAQGLAQKKDATDQDKQNALTLIQQSIQQAKIAAALDPNNSANWDTLSTVYQALIGAAQDADSWTVAAMVQEIQTDPSNPQLRFNLASVYRSIGNNDQALSLFQQAAQLKSDYANAYYNMADIYQKKGDKQNQLVMLAQTLQLLKPEASDYGSVKQQVENLQKELQSAASSNANATPAPSAKPKATPVATPVATPDTTNQVNLPTDAGMTPSPVPEVPQQ